MTPEGLRQLLGAAAPPTPARSPRRTCLVSAPKLLEARALLDAGKSRGALDLLKACGELKDLAGTDARLLAGDVARNLGAPRLARYLHLRAWRSAPGSLEAQAAGLHALLEAAGVYATWRRLRRPELSGDFGSGSGAQQLCLLRAAIAASFHDFESADQWWQKAESRAARNPALYVTLAVILEREARFEEALLAARKAVELRPGYPGGYRAAAHFLQLLNRDEESVSVLEEGTRRCQSVPLLCDLAVLQSAMDQHAEVSATLDAAMVLSPIIEKDLRDWLLDFRTRVAWRAGNVSGAIVAAREHGTPAALRFAERLEAPGTRPRRLQLSVPFVRQQQDTCTPATLSALSRFWGRPAEHLEVVDEICYLGTPAHAGRIWADRHGWLTREFTVTWEAAKALLDRGVPFAMFTLSADSGHAQAVVGYDEAQRTFIVRDSNFHHLVEYNAETLLEEQRLSGPAGLVLLPVEKTSLLEGLELPEAGLRDQIHCFHQALDSHCREAAAQALGKLQAGAPAHALTLAADLALCSYDGNTQLTIRCLDRLLERHPQNERLLLQKLGCLGGPDQRDERLALLSRACDRPKCSPAFMLRYADELRQDARELDQAASWVRRALRKGFGHQALDCLAAVHWAQLAFPEALELYRFAACLNDKSERAAQQYFAVARHLNQTERALQFLRKRFERYRRRSPFPAISLCQALIQLGRRPEAIQVLAEALELRPEDGELRVYAAQIAFASGQDAEAGEHLRGAEGRISASRLSRERAKLASGQKDLQPAISLWREILRREPLALDAHQEVARLLAETEGGLAGCRHLEEACKANPRHVGLHQMLFSWLAPEGPRAVESVLESLITLNPADAGIRCERARWLGRLTRWTEALAEADLAVELDPSHPVGHALRGWALKAEGRRQEAMEAYRRAVTVSVDYDLSIMQGLVSCAATVLERRLALNFLQTELSRHLVYGNGVLAYRELAAGELHADEVIKILQKVVAERPDLWHAWAAVIREFAAQRKFEQAVKAAESATARLPLSAELWNEVAALHQARNDSKSELAAREKALELSPGDIQAMRLLADGLGRAGELARARAILEGALRTYPRDAGTLYLMALSHWKAKEKDPAIARIKEAVAFRADFAPGWVSLQSWGCEVGQPGLAREMAQRLTEQRKEDPAAWLRLARFHWCDKNVGEALRVVDQAIALRPTSVEARILKAQILTREERFAEAAEVCNQTVWGAVAPAELRAMAACILQAEGRCAEAIAKMEAALADAPELLWAWENLADWHLAEGKIDTARAVTERISKAFPNSPIPLLRAASEYHGAGNYLEATELLEKALRLDPDCVETRRRLVIIQLQTNQFAAVRETIAALRKLGIEDWALAAEGCLSLQQSDVGFACVRLTELCSMPGAGNAAVDLLSNAFFNLGHGPPMCEALERALETPEPFAGTGGIWVAAMSTKGRLPPLTALFKLQGRRRLFRLTSIQFLRSVGCLASSAKFPIRLLSVPLFRWTLLRLKRRLGDLLHNDTEAWVEFALALAATGRKGACRKWIADWRTRKKLRGSYFIFFELLSDLGKDADALEIGGEALRQASGRDRIRVQMRLAWLEANLGDTQSAAKLLEDLEKDSSLVPLCVVVRWIIRVRDAAPEVRAREAVDGFNSIRLSLSRQYLANSCEFVRRYTRRSVDLLAAQGAGFQARLWGARNTRPPLPHFHARD